MAKKKVAASAGANKTQTKTDAIRLALAKDESPSAVAKMLNSQGIKVSAQYVSTIKAADKRRASSGAPHRKPGRPVGSGTKNRIAGVARGNGTHAFEDLKEASELMLKAVELVLKAGAKEAKQLVSMAENMVERIKD